MQCGNIRSTTESDVMQRLTITIDDELKNDIDRIIAERGYQNRSEAIRDLARAGLTRAAEDTVEADNCVAALIYAYSHSTRQLPRRLARTFHDHHVLTLGTLHLHVDVDTCLEVNLLKGASSEIKELADHVIAERGVRHGRVVTVPVEKPDAGKAKKRSRHVHR
jgi:CopG family transcriptional regulator, nickel-responsive regulator